MNSIRAGERLLGEMDRIREIVSRHALPDNVTGFDVELGEFDGDPILSVVFHVAGSAPELDFRKDRGILARNGAIVRAIRDDLLEAVDDRYPHFRFARRESALAQGR